MLNLQHTEWTTEAARRILAVWPAQEPVRVDRELRAAEELCSRPAQSAIEAERRDLLAGIVGALRDAATRSDPSQAGSLDACFTLLRHLTSAVQPSMPVRARTLHRKRPLSQSQRTSRSYRCQ